MNYVLLILAGGTGAGLLPFVVARHLVGQHADRTAAAIRRQSAPARSRELVR